MLDLHCHILPRVNDGPQTLEESLAMARLFVADGVTHVVATPHCHRYIHLLRVNVLPHVVRLNRELDSAGIPVTILPGSEIQVTDSDAFRREYDAEVYCHLGDRRDFTLLEFNWSRGLYPADAVQLIEWLRQHGTTPILAHPERMDYFWKEPTLLSDLIGPGAWMQITVDSLLGKHGPSPQTSAESLVRQYPNVVLATDSHNLGRCSGLTLGYNWIAAMIGSERADDLRRRAEFVLDRLIGDEMP